ncbi:hypothetical protein L6452_37034 [Arctium lappa]|uniref:Uncharacterized protein n=1 Tax=Arctium lappa TaxID=4217 RepID=A0ACB8Y2D9_ARCLA|nr:hypothetical protein L6452_37034 [Arctium lappa]
MAVDVYLICSNAMQYNPSDNVFYRQARSIQELAKRDFENLRQEGDDGELQPKAWMVQFQQDKAIRRFLVRNIVEQAVVRVVQEVCAFDWEEAIPMSSTVKNYIKWGWMSHHDIEIGYGPSLDPQDNRAPKSELISYRPSFRQEHIYWYQFLYELKSQQISIPIFTDF